MPVLARNLVFISEKVRENENAIYSVLKKFCTERLCHCKILEESDVSLTEDKEKIQSIRYGCITDQTRLVVAKNLIDAAIPIILFASSKESDYIEGYIRDLSAILDNIDINILRRMVFKLETDPLPKSKVPWEILGAIRWVHNYYYLLEEKKGSLLEENQRMLKLCQEKRRSLEEMLEIGNNSMQQNTQNVQFLMSAEEIRKLLIDKGREDGERMSEVMNKRKDILPNNF